MTIKKLAAGKYQVIHHGFVFDLINEMDYWILWNYKGTEIFSYSTKKSCLVALSTYNQQGTENLNDQDFCSY